MNKIKIESKKHIGKFTYKFEMPEGEYRDYVEEYAGFCVFCGEQHDDNCEPDARGYECSYCERKGVYGTEELLMMGRVEFI